MTQSKTLFTAGQSYSNVYFIKVDASGHSTIVRTNPADSVDKLFDLVEEHVLGSVKDSQRLFNCEYADFWGWQGDGGLCVIYDPNESTAAKASIESALNVLDHKLPNLQTILSKLGIKGELHLRIAIHKGHFTYKGSERLGSIHSKDLNFVAHLEQVTPSDSVAISEDVWHCCPPELQGRFNTLDFTFEEKKVFLCAKSTSTVPIYEWLTQIDIKDSSKVTVFSDRPEELEKAQMIRRAEVEVVDLGTSLRTCSDYLTSSRRPAYYRDTVLALLDRGVNYVCVVLDPSADMTKWYGDLRGEDLKTKGERALERLSLFANDAKGRKGHFKVFAYSVMPYFASIAVDRKTEGLFLFSPYLPIERADTMHVLLAKWQDSKLYLQIDECIDKYYLGHPSTKQII